MDVLVTGGGGFVLSTLVRHLLETDPSATATVVDVSPIDDVLDEYFEPIRTRLTYIEGDARDGDLLGRLCASGRVTHVVDGATVTQAEEERLYIDGNVGATTELIDRARELDGLERYLYISSVAVYGEADGHASAATPAEDGPLRFEDLYAISKFASEEICRLYGDIFGVDVRGVRLGRLFGPMERVTPGRNRMSIPYHMMHAAVEHRPLRVQAGALGEGSDFISSEDTAFALAKLLRADRLAHNTYNVVSGAFTTVRDLLTEFRNALPELEFELVDDREGADVFAGQIPMRTRPEVGAYSMQRLGAEVGWSPRSLSDQVASYVGWALAEPGGSLSRARRFAPVEASSDLLAKRTA